MALKPRHGAWAYGKDARTPVDAARELRWGGYGDPGDWHRVTRAFRDGHAEVVRIYGLRHWVEQSHKQVKDELGWADFQVRSDIAIRRHQALVNCAFSFCWDTWLASPPPPGPTPAGPQERGHGQPAPAAPHASGYPSSTQLAPRPTCGPQPADPRDHAHALVAGLAQSAPAR